MARLVVESAALKDLNEMWESGDQNAEAAVATIEVALQEIKHDDEFLSRMWRRHEMRHQPPTIEADRIVSQWKKGKNLLRLKIWDFPEDSGTLLAWRVVCAYDGRSDCYHVLGIIRRDTDYDQRHPHI